MSDGGDRTCPLCTEEMDLTDQQLKPCKCGYEVCVWCWHHIIEMAEKEGVEGRCPACRTRYDKERIVGTAANCERMLAEISAERRYKSQKAKPKASIEGRKHLSNVRVVQKNLAYIIGMPSHLADESILERKEYFGQYGKVLKVSISRHANSVAAYGAQQASNNSTFSVYITYAREEEAIRCIRAVHNFVLEGKPLRACFGTTKYCHSWLKNMICSNPDCLYLHEVGSQEDVCTNDEIISAYTRSRVPQIGPNSLQRRLGNVLPSPEEELHSNGTVSGKHAKHTANSNSSHVKASPLVSVVAKTGVLPPAASWGVRTSNSRTTPTSASCSQAHARQKVEPRAGSAKQTSPFHDDAVTVSTLADSRHEEYLDVKSRPLQTSNHCISWESQATIKTVSSENLSDATNDLIFSAWDDDGAATANIVEGRHVVHTNENSWLSESSRTGAGSLKTVSDGSLEIGETEHNSAWSDDDVVSSEGSHERQARNEVGKACPQGTLKGKNCNVSMSDLSDTTMGAHSMPEIPISCSSDQSVPAFDDRKRVITVSVSNINPGNSRSSEGLVGEAHSYVHEKASCGSRTGNQNVDSLCVGLTSASRDNSLMLVHPYEYQQHGSGMDTSPPSSLQQYNFEKVAGCLSSIPSMKNPTIAGAHVSNELPASSSETQNQGLAFAGSTKADALEISVTRQSLSDAISQSPSLSRSNYLCHISNDSSNASNRSVCTSSHSFSGGSKSIETESNRLLRLRGNESVVVNGKEEDIFRGSPRYNVKVKSSEAYGTEMQVRDLESSHIVGNSHKKSIIEEESIIADVLSLDFDPWDDSLSSANSFPKLFGESKMQNGPLRFSSSWKLQNSNQSRFSFARQENEANHPVADNQNLCPSFQGSSGDDFPSPRCFEGPNVPVDSNLVALSDRTAGVSRAKITAPPGFSVPNNISPPGFSYTDRVDQAYDISSGNHLLGGTPLQNQYQMPVAANNGDVEFIDPAILAVGKGRLPLGMNNSSVGSSAVFPPQFSTLESDHRLQLLMQQSVSPYQDRRISGHSGEILSPLSDTYVPSRLLSHSQSSLSPFSQMSLQQARNSYMTNSHWDAWNVQNVTDMRMADILRDQRFGSSNRYTVSEDIKLHMPGSGDLYSRAFGM